MSAPSRAILGGVLALAVVAGGGLLLVDRQPPGGEAVRTPPAPKARDLVAREKLYAELQPVRLANCTLQRFGEPHDGGYLMCGNLLGGIQAGYSYGISGYDGWGCDVSRGFGVRVHQYDCFNLTEPLCPGGDTVFHPECIAGAASVDPDGRAFETLESQLSRNGDAGRNIVLKMDVEGAEWESLLAAPDDLLQRVDQLAIEFHGVDARTGTFLELIGRLKDIFHIVHLHFNNYSCVEGVEPFPAWAYEVLFVNKRLGQLAEDQSEVRRPHPLDAPNNPAAPDCQYARSSR